MADGKARPGPPARSDFVHLRPIQTRWMDNDVYGHVNNVVYYSFFDTLVNAFTVEAGVLDPAASPAIALVVETGCRYHRAIGFPETVEGGLRVDRLGRTSVTYALAIFRAGEEAAAADGHFVHVYVDRDTRRPAEIPDAVRRVLSGLLPAA